MDFIDISPQILSLVYPNVKLLLSSSYFSIFFFTTLIKFLFSPIDHPSQRQHDVCMMMEDSERFDLAFDYAWVDLNSKLYDETKQLVKKLWDGPLDSGKFL